MRKRFWKALRPLEFIIIFMVIGITLGVFAWRYDHFKARAMQSEAKFFLGEIYAAQLLYHNKNHNYASLHELMANKLVTPKTNYYSFEEGEAPTKTSFLIFALGNNKLVINEQWSVDQSGEIKLGDK